MSRIEKISFTVKRHNVLIRLAHRIFKNQAEKVSSRFKAFREFYSKSLIPLYFNAYISLILFLSILAFTLLFILGMSIHLFILHYPLTISILLSVLLGLIATGITVWILIANPVYRVSSLRRRLELILPHATGYIAGLASAGLSIEHILERTVELQPEPILTHIARLIIRDVHVFGQDIVTALRNAIVSSPSGTLASILNGVINTIITSGDLRSYFLYTYEKLIAKKRDQLRRVIDNLTYLAEMYIALVVVGPIILIIILIIISMLGGFLIDPAVTLLILTFIGIPFIGIVFLIIIDAFLGSI
ncbi:MAG: type II secretion system F family protein [Candidatus Methanomethylicia archaeon]